VVVAVGGTGELVCVGVTGELVGAGVAVEVGVCVAGATVAVLDGAAVEVGVCVAGITVAVADGVAVEVGVCVAGTTVAVADGRAVGVGQVLVPRIGTFDKTLPSTSPVPPTSLIEAVNVVSTTLSPGCSCRLGAALNDTCTLEPAAIAPSWSMKPFVVNVRDGVPELGVTVTDQMRIGTCEFHSGARLTTSVVSAGVLTELVFWMSSVTVKLRKSQGAVMLGVVGMNSSGAVVVGPGVTSMAATRSRDAFDCCIACVEPGDSAL
jgi:hypothetical protein